MTTENNPANNSNNKPDIKNKKNGIIRWEAIVPFSIVLTVTVVYFLLFFDAHIKSAIEWAGYKALGTEVNLAQFKSSFINGQVSLTKLEITSAENPNFNSIELGQIRYAIKWDALLRLKFVVEEMAIENVQFMSKRKYPGKVAPPPPPSNEPSLVNQLQGKALSKVGEKGKDNLLGDLAAFLQTGDYKSQLNNLESKLVSKQLANDLKSKWEQKQKDWDLKIKSLPTDKDFKDYKTKFDAIKYKDFKSPQELQDSINKFNSLKAEVEDKVKLVNDTKKSLSEDLKAIKSDYENLDKQIKADIASLKDHLKIPKIDAAQIAKSIFMDYLTPYIQKLDKVNQLAEKYLPPKYSKMVNDNLNTDSLLSKKSKKVSADDDDAIQPHPRASGVTYEFPKTNGYPLFWIKSIKVSSKSNAQTDYGDIAGEISNIVSNQRQIGKQTELNIAGNLRSQNITGLKIKAFLNNLQTEPSAGLEFGISNYPINAIKLISSNDGNIDLPKANLAINANVSTIGFNQYDLTLNNIFNEVQFSSSAKEKVIDELLKNAFSQINTFDLNAQASGSLKDLDMRINSSLGKKLEEALSASVKQKIEELNKEIKQKIDNEIGKVKSEIDKQINTLTKGYVANASDVEAKLNSQKSLVDEKIAIAKKDLENKAKSKAEEEGKKVLDNLKKKLKF